MKNYLVLLSFLCLMGSVEGQHMVANINLSTGDSEPIYLVGNDDYGAYFASNADGDYAIYYLVAGDVEATRFPENLPLEEGYTILEAALIENDLYICLRGSVGNDQQYLRADLAEETLVHLVTLPGTYNNVEFVHVPESSKVRFIHSESISNYKLYETDGTSDGTQALIDLPGDEFPDQLLHHQGYTYISYLHNQVNDDIPATVYTYDGTSLIQANPPLGDPVDITVTPLENGVLLTGFESGLKKHVIASSGLNTFFEIANFTNYPGIDLLEIAFVQGDDVYFVYRNANDDNQLYRSNVDAASLEPVIQLNPDGDIFSVTLTSFDQDAGLLYYHTGLSSDGSSFLFRSDLTDAGTFSLTEIDAPLITDFSFGENRILNSQYYFFAHREETGRELWISDGTVAGTRALTDLIPGPQDSEIENFTIMAGQVGFSATTLGFGEEVFVNDGTVDGTRLLADVNTREESSGPLSFYSFGNDLLFNADDGCRGGELYKTGGTAATTKMVKEIGPGPVGSGFSVTAEVDGKLYYRTKGKIVETDGTEEGTNVIFNNESNGNFSIFPPGRIDDDVLIAAADYEGFMGMHLFRFSPATGTIDVVTSLNASNFVQVSKRFIALSNTLALFDVSSQNGNLLYRTDGTESGTYVIPITGIDNVASIVLEHAFEGIAYFTVADFSGTKHLYRSDGTNDGTYRLEFPDFEEISRVFFYDGKLHFFANHQQSTGLYRIDPVTEVVTSTGLLAGLDQYGETFELVGDRIYFSARNETTGFELWTISEPEQPAELVVDLRSGNASSSPWDLTVVGQTLYFSAQGDVGDRDLYQTDGMTQNTFPIREMTGYETGFRPGFLHAHLEQLYYTAYDSLKGFELFRFVPDSPMITSGDVDVAGHCSDSIVSVEEIAQMIELSVYPNPTSNFIRISTDVEQSTAFTQWQVIDVRGARVLSGDLLTADGLIEVGTLPTGHYYLLFGDQGKIVGWSNFNKL